MSVHPPLILRSYLKRLFKDLFERSGFEDDGESNDETYSHLLNTGRFDWDILLKEKNNGAAGEAKLPAPEPVGAVNGGVPPPTEQHADDPSLVNFSFQIFCDTF